MRVELDWIRRGLADRMPSRVAEKTGLHPNTIRAIRDGRNIDPKLSTLDKLAEYLSEQGE